MLILFGTKSVGRTIKTGNFLCPRCQTERQYQLRENRKYFTLFFVPLIPLDKLQDTLECKYCHTAYIPQSILEPSEYTPQVLATDGLSETISSFGARIGSFFIDSVLLVLLNFPLAMLASSLKDYLPKNFILTFLPIWFLYFFLMEWLLKGTVGKKICKIKIVSDSDGEVSVFQYFIRAFVKMIPIVNIIVFFNDKHKGCHDFAAQTIVVDK
ncbi:RDD family protein [Soonwooa sp.]|uniref:RDD family protein n=1 Tax=Soonwooa sp. TaxID=1938592 RepID=UPI0026226F61|nr:RDD family protein [Soonwooa sp.]